MRGVAIRAVLVASLVVPGGMVAAQTAAQHVAEGDSAYVARNAVAALAHYEAALALDPRDYAALWRASRSAVDLGEFEPDASKRAALYRTAQERAQLAVEVDPGDAEGHFALARALGRSALTLGVRDRVKYAGRVRAQALECLRLAPNHGGCLHVMGVWNAEVMRLNAFQRMFARNFLGGRVFGEASWANALRYMLAAVAADPRRIVHKLDLARVYRDMGDRAKAREEYQAVLDGPVIDYNDPHYKEQAAAELRKL